MNEGDARQRIAAMEDVRSEAAASTVPSDGSRAVEASHTTAAQNSRAEAMVFALALIPGMDALASAR